MRCVAPALEAASGNLIAELGLGRSWAFGQPGSLVALDLYLLGKEATVLRKKEKLVFLPLSISGVWAVQ